MSQPSIFLFFFFLLEHKKVREVHGFCKQIQRKTQRGEKSLDEEEEGDETDLDNERERKTKPPSPNKPRGESQDDFLPIEI